LALFADYGVPFCRIGWSAQPMPSNGGGDGRRSRDQDGGAGILHKSDVGGVRLNLTRPDAVRAAYQDVARWPARDSYEDGRKGVNSPSA
jgi:hypothetical protein